MTKKRVKRDDRYFNTYDLGGWMNGVNSKIDASSFGKAIGGSSGLGGITNAAASMVSGAINPSGNSTGAGNVLQSIGSMASNIPGIGGVIGAGVNLVGGLVNTMFGSNLNEEFIAQTEDKTKQQAGYTSLAKDNASLLSDWASYTDMAHVKQDDVGSDGWFSNKAKNKTKSLNRAIDEANLRAWHSLSNTASNVDTNNDFLAMANFSAYGGPIFSTGAIGYDLASRDLNNKQMKALGDMRLTSLPNSFTAMPEINTFSKGGGIHIKKKNRGKFTDYCGGKVTSECIQRGLHSSNPTTRKRANFARNARKWHGDGGPLDSLVSDINSRSKAVFVQRLLDPNRAYIPDWESDRIATHKLSYATDDNGAIVFPNVQRIDGKLYDFTDPKNKRGKWDALDSAIESGDTLRMTPAQAEEFTKTYKRYYPKGKTFRAFGGWLNSQGGDFTNGVTFIDNGGSHEVNPFEGVQIGIDPQGVPNLVEEGEVIFNDYVFSDRMKVPKKLKEKYNIKGETFADAAKQLSKESEERPNDPISQRGLEAFMSALAESQEEVRIKNEDRRMNRYAKGGKLGKIFEGEGSGSNFLQFYTPEEKYIKDLQDAGILSTFELPSTEIPFFLRTPYQREQAFNRELPKFSLIDDRIEAQKWVDNNIKPVSIDSSVSNKRKSKQSSKSKDSKNASYLRYAPALMSGISTFADIFSEPDYSAADRIASIDIQPALVSADPIGQYLSYKPLDRMFYINQLNRNAAASRRAVQNTTGGNRAAALAGILAADYNYGENLGKLARQAEEYNQALKERVAGFNRQTDMFNSQQSMQAQSTNAQSRDNATRMRLAQAEEVARLRQAARNAYDARRSNNLNSFITNLGNIGLEEYQREWINSNPALYYYLSGIGEVGYKGNGKKNGGKLKKRKRV